MALPPLGVVLLEPTCRPPGFGKYLDVPNKVIRSGYTVDGNGNVPGKPTAMAEAAATAIRQDTSLPPAIRARGAAVPLEVYTLARYVTSEVGTENIADAVAVLQDAVNRAKYVERTGNVNRLLLYRQKLGGEFSKNYGYYGPINVRVTDEQGKKFSAPFGRWAATTKDPTVRAIVLAQDVLAEVIDPAFNKGADDQANITIFANPPAKIRELAKNNKFWVGQLPGTSHRRSMHFRDMPGLDDASKKKLIDRAINALSAPAVDWKKYPVCSDAGPGAGDGTKSSAMSAIPGGGVAALAIGTATLTAAGIVGYALHRRTGD